MTYLERLAPLTIAQLDTSRKIQPEHPASAATPAAKTPDQPEAELAVANLVSCAQQGRSASLKVLNRFSRIEDGKILRPVWQVLDQIAQNSPDGFTSDDDFQTGSVLIGALGLIDNPALAKVILDQLWRDYPVSLPSLFIPILDSCRQLAENTGNISFMEEMLFEMFASFQTIEPSAMPDYSAAKLELEEAYSCLERLALADQCPENVESFLCAIFRLYGSIELEVWRDWLVLKITRLAAQPQGQKELHHQLSYLIDILLVIEENASARQSLTTIKHKLDVKLAPKY